MLSWDRGKEFFFFFRFYSCFIIWGASLVAQLVETLPAMWETQLVPGLGRSPGEGNVNPLQYSCLENFMDRGAWKATVHGVTKSQTWLKWLSTHTLLKWYLSTSLLERWLAPQPEVIISNLRMQNSGLFFQLWVLRANTGKLKKILQSILHYRAIL